MLQTELPLLQQVASSVPTADSLLLSNCLPAAQAGPEETLQSQVHGPAGVVPAEMQEPQVTHSALFLTASERCIWALSLAALRSQ